MGGFGIMGIPGQTMGVPVVIPPPPPPGPPSTGSGGGGGYYLDEHWKKKIKEIEDAKDKRQRQEKIVRDEDDFMGLLLACDFDFGLAMAIWEDQ
jgi:hypothetical protein